MPLVVRLPDRGVALGELRAHLAGYDRPGIPQLRYALALVIVDVCAEHGLASVRAISRAAAIPNSTLSNYAREMKGYARPPHLSANAPRLLAALGRATTARSPRTVEVSMEAGREPGGLAPGWVEALIGKWLDGIVSDKYAELMGDILDVLEAADEGLFAVFSFMRYIVAERAGFSRNLLSLGVEKELVGYLVQIGCHGVPVDRDLVTDCAEHLATMLMRGGGRITQAQHFVLGVSWGRRFLARHKGLSTRNRAAPERAGFLCATRPALTAFYDILEPLYSRLGRKGLLDPENIWNMDEYPIKVDRSPPREHREVGAVTGLASSKYVSMIACISARGGRMAPLIVNSALLLARVGTRTVTTDKGFATRAAIRTWFLDIFLPEASRRRGTPILIFGHPNADVADEITALAALHGVEAVALPGCTAHALQPLDVADFATLQTELKKAIKHAPAAEGAAASVPELAAQTFMAMPLARNSFAKTGIWPLDRTAVTPDEPAGEETGDPELEEAPKTSRKLPKIARVAAAPKRAVDAAAPLPPPKRVCEIVRGSVWLDECDEPYDVTM